MTSANYVLKSVGYTLKKRTTKELVKIRRASGAYSENLARGTHPGAYRCVGELYSACPIPTGSPRALGHVGLHASSQKVQKFLNFFFVLFLFEFWIFWYNYIWSLTYGSLILIRKC